MMRQRPSWLGQRAMSIVLALAALSIVGIVGLLVAGPVVDWIFLVLVALPLVVGAYVVRRPARIANR